ncbi:GWxTD domain-containing protein [bacterium]|nr:GWxTD domain-containing protein [bacterium]
MKCIRTGLIFWLIFVYASISQSVISTRNAHTGYKNHNAKFSYQFLIFSTASPDTNRLMLFVKLANPSLQFIKADSIYEARYELSAVVLRENRDIIDSQIKRGLLKSKHYKMTQLATLVHYEYFEFLLAPDKYMLNIELYDIETRQSVRSDVNLQVPDFSGQTIACTDIVFLKSLNLDSLETLEPLMPPVRLPEDTSFCARIDLFAQGRQDIRIFETILNDRGKAVYRDTVEVRTSGGRHPVFFKLTQELPFGQYALQLDLTEGSIKKQVSSKFYVQWEGHPTSIGDLKLAVQSLIYVMDRKDWRELEEASGQEQKDLIEAFWQSRDPVPETAINELEEEYYQRVTIANREFSVLQHNQNGWETDRGRIYIIYGPPSEVNSPLIQSQSPGRYEIWDYGLQRRFVFYDKYGNGNYKLISQE